MSELSPTVIQDKWLETASELLDAFRNHEAVARLVEHRRYQTRGRGTTITGIKLSHDSGVVVATVGLVLLSPAPGRTVAGVAQQLRYDMHDAWARVHGDARITINIDVLGIQS